MGNSSIDHLLLSLVQDIYNVIGLPFYSYLHILGFMWNKIFLKSKLIIVKIYRLCEHENFTTS